MGEQSSLTELLDVSAIDLGARAASKEDAVRACGDKLVEIGAVGPAYVEAMLERERTISTYVGEGVAIPHGTLAGKDAVVRDALCYLRFSDPVDWGGEEVTVCVGIAAAGDGHVDVLAALAQVLMDPEQAAALRAAQRPEDVLAALAPREEEEVST
ncbi:MAG: mannitol system component [Actinomycetota bacterium]|jgi:PTS system mannitol-specific IIA component|nr:mannitol system component [Actinomycetota bacterium]